MITGELRNKVDQIWQTIWTGGITSPITVLEQITYLMFMKLLDDNQLKAEANAAALGVALKERVFKDLNERLDRMLPWNLIEKQKTMTDNTMEILKLKPLGLYVI